MIRMPRFRRARTATAVVALIATTGATLLVGISPASAVTTDWTVAAVSKPTIVPATASQAAGNYTVTTAADTVVTVGDSISFTVDDSDGGNCAVTGDFIEFSADPTVTVTAPTTGAPTYSVARSSSGACSVSGKKNVLTITAIASGAAGTFTISGIKYTTGSGVAAGDVVVTAATATGTINSAASPQAVAANAKISLFKVTANTPPVGLKEGSTGNAISDITIQEFKAGDVGTGYACVSFNIEVGAQTVYFSNAGTASATGGGSSASGAQFGGTVPTTSNNVAVSFATVASTSGAATYKLSGLKLDSVTDEKFTTVKVGTGATRDDACNNYNVSTDTNIAFVMDIIRLGGGDRFSTAQIIFDDEFGCYAPYNSGNDTAIIATGGNFPDALAASYLAGFTGTGILLTNRDTIPSATLNALRQEGINNVYIVGGTSAISQAVADQLAATPQHDCGGAVLGGTPTPKLNVTRIGGATRYDTAQDIAEFPGLGNAGRTDMDIDATSDGAGTQLDCQPVVTAILASGENFPDALSAGPLAYSGDEGDCTSDYQELPLLLTQKDTLSSAAAAALTNLNVQQVILMGGTAAVSPAVQTAITAMGINVVRIAGTTRQLTAAALANVMADPSNFDKTDGNFGLARGDTFPDALTLGPAAGDYGQESILLTDSPTSLGTAAADVITNMSSKLIADLYNLVSEYPECTDELHVAGGISAVSASVVQAAMNAAAAQSRVRCMHSLTIGDA